MASAVSFGGSQPAAGAISDGLDRTRSSSTSAFSSEQARYRRSMRLRRRTNLRSATRRPPHARSAKKQPSASQSAGYPLRDMAATPAPSAANTPANTKAGVGSASTSDALVATSGALASKSNPVVRGRGPPPDAWLRNVATALPTLTPAQRSQRSSALRRLRDPSRVAKDLPGDDLARYPVVAIGIASSGCVGTIALQECDRRADGVVRRYCAAEFGRFRKSGGDADDLRPTAAFSAGACNRTDDS